jgi:hypothetical protein
MDHITATVNSSEAVFPHQQRGMLDNAEEVDGEWFWATEGSGSDAIVHRVYSMQLNMWREAKTVAEATFAIADIWGYDVPDDVPNAVLNFNPGARMTTDRRSNSRCAVNLYGR